MFLKLLYKPRSIYGASNIETPSEEYKTYKIFIRVYLSQTDNVWEWGTARSQMLWRITVFVGHVKKIT